MAGLCVFLACWHLFALEIDTNWKKNTNISETTQAGKFWIMFCLGIPVPLSLGDNFSGVHDCRMASYDLKADAL